MIHSDYSDGVTLLGSSLVDSSEVLEPVVTCHASYFLPISPDGKPGAVFSSFSRLISYGALKNYAYC